MERRTFLGRIAAGCHVAAACIIGWPAFRFLLHPFQRRMGTSAFVRVRPATAGSLTRPERFVVHRDRWDSFVHYPPGPVGAVWLVPGSAADGPPSCLQTICPHLGCNIEYDTGRAVFYCPCHASDFDLNGQRLRGPSPRDMDALACRVSEVDDQGTAWIEIRYEEFQTGRPDRRLRA